MGKIPVKFPAAARRLNLAAECEGMGFYGTPGGKYFEYFIKMPLGKLAT
jgi:hypothetical protein